MILSKRFHILRLFLSVSEHWCLQIDKKIFKTASIGFINEFSAKSIFS